MQLAAMETNTITFITICQPTFLNILSDCAHIVSLEEGKLTSGRKIRNQMPLWRHNLSTSMQNVGFFPTNV